MGSNLSLCQSIRDDSKIWLAVLPSAVLLEAGFYCFAQWQAIQHHLTTCQPTVKFWSHLLPTKFVMWKFYILRFVLFIAMYIAQIKYKMLEN